MYIYSSQVLRFDSVMYAQLDATRVRPPPLYFKTLINQNPNINNLYSNLTTIDLSKTKLTYEDTYNIRILSVGCIVWHRAIDVYVM